MNLNEDITTEEKLRKALWAATVFCKYNYKGIDAWVVEHRIVTRKLVGNQGDINKMFAEHGTGEVIEVRTIAATRYDWWEAHAIALALEQQKYLPEVD